MAEGTSAAKSIERNKSQATAAKYWARVNWERFETRGIKSHEEIGLEKAQAMAADNARHARRIGPLPVINL